MVLFFVMFCSTGILGCLVLCAHAAISWKTWEPLASQSPFECGFSAKMPSRPPISLQFFLIALIFLIFDMELILLYPALATTAVLTPSKIYSLILFLAIISYSTFIEWSQRMLEWVK